MIALPPTKAGVYQQGDQTFEPEAFGGSEFARRLAQLGVQANLRAVVASAI
jgi:hypothetical protein